MPAKHKEIFEELKSVVTGKTLDALLPPLAFVIVNGLAGLDQAIVFALGLAWVNTILGGPGVEEYQSGEKPPWQGQIRGF